MYTPVNPSFTIEKWGLRGSKLYRHVFVMKSPCPIGEIATIINGHEATKGQFPYQATTRYHDYLWCGAAPIAPYWVISAKHCFWEGYVSFYLFYNLIILAPHIVKHFTQCKVIFFKLPLSPEQKSVGSIFRQPSRRSIFLPSSQKIYIFGNVCNILIAKL